MAEIRRRHHQYNHQHKDKTRQVKTRQDKTRQEKTRLETRQDKTRQAKTIQDKIRQDKAKQDKHFFVVSSCRVLSCLALCLPSLFLLFSIHALLSFLLSPIRSFLLSLVLCRCVCPALSCFVLSLLS
jgi:hypothetical protein